MQGKVKEEKVKNHQFMKCCICGYRHIKVGDSAIAFKKGKDVLPAHLDCVKWYNAYQEVKEELKAQEDAIMQRFRGKSPKPSSRTKRSNEGKGINHIS